MQRTLLYDEKIILKKFGDNRYEIDGITEVENHPGVENDTSGHSSVNFLGSMKISLINRFR